MLYSIAEIFYSIQGEGRNTGMPAWFIRLAGCNKNCRWCDTDHSPKVELNEFQIMEQLKTSYCKNAVITGGEPTIQDLIPLLRILKKEKYYVALETNGTNDLMPYKRECLLDWITVSPKTDDINPDAIVDEVKVIWPTEMDLKKVIQNIDADYYYLQPLDDKNKESNIKSCVDVILENPKWRLSLQTQKILQLR